MSELQDKIAAARGLPGRPHDQRDPIAPSVGALLSARAAATPDAPFLAFLGGAEPVRFTYQEFARRVEAFAAHLAGHHQVDEGDRIATLSVNHHDTVTAYFAAWWLGATVVPISISEEDDRVQYMLENCGAKLLLAHASQMSRAFELSRRCPAVRSVLPVASAGRRMPDSDGPLSPREPALDHEALIVYTSGTTGPPKGVSLSQYNLLADAAAIAGWHGLSAASRLMCVLPIHHVNGTVVTLLTPLAAGGAVTLCARFHAGSFFADARSERVQVISVVPTLLKYLLERHAGEAFDRGSIPDLEYLVCGAGPLTVELAREFEDRFGVRVLHGYGLSETTCYSCFLPVDLAPERHRHWMSAFGFPSIGVALPVNEMAILDTGGRPAAAGERGEIAIRGHNVMREYFRRPEANAEAFRTGWFHSGDEGFWQPDEDGRKYFFITGRLKELIIRGGVKVAPLELDEVLARIPGVRRALAVGFESSWMGEEVGAYVEPDPDFFPLLTPDAVIEHCRRLLPFHKTPKVVVFGSEIPVTTTGKYQRNRLRGLFLAHRDVQFREPKGS